MIMNDMVIMCDMYRGWSRWVHLPLYVSLPRHFSRASSQTENTNRKKKKKKRRRGRRRRKKKEEEEKEEEERKIFLEAQRERKRETFCGGHVEQNRTKNRQRDRIWGTSTHKHKEEKGNITSTFYGMYVHVMKQSSTHETWPPLDLWLPLESMLARGKVSGLWRSGHPWWLLRSFPKSQWKASCRPGLWDLKIHWLNGICERNETKHTCVKFDVLAKLFSVVFVHMFANWFRKLGLKLITNACPEWW